MEEIRWPHILYHPTEPSRIFASREELEAAGPGWVLTPDEASDAAALAAEAAPETPPPPRSRR